MATEKGMVTRRFALSRGAHVLLTEYIRDVHPGAATSHWLFPSPRQPRLPVTPIVVNHVLQRACQKAGIAGRFTHSHAVRKFVVVRLMQEEENRIEDISKWIGHKTVDLFGRDSDAFITIQ
jgi:integrase